MIIISIAIVVLVLIHRAIKNKPRGVTNILSYRPSVKNTFGDSNQCNNMNCNWDAGGGYNGCTSDCDNADGDYGFPVASSTMTYSDKCKINMSYDSNTNHAIVNTTGTCLWQQ